MGVETVKTGSFSWPVWWQQVSLADAGRWMSGGTPSTSNEAYWDGDIPWISGASMKRFRITDSERRVTRLGAENGSRLVDKGAVLFIVRGMSLKSEFRIGVTQREVAFGQDCKALVPDDGIDPYYLAHAMRVLTPTILSLVEETSHGTGRLDTNRLSALDIGVPPLSEQRDIVAAHEAFERRIGALERMLAKVEIAESALSAHALGQVGTAGPRLDSVATVAAGVTLGSEFVGDGTIELPYLRVANVLDGRIDTTDVKTVRIVKTQYERYALRKGDLLLTEGGDLDKLGRGAVWDGRIDECLHQNHVFRVRCGEQMLPDFLALYAASPEGRAYFQRVGKQTTNLASINSTQVKQMPVPVPPVEEQRRLLGPVHAARERAAVLQQQIAKLRTIQQGVIEDLLSGRSRVNRT
ncbi:restriction endonuclease subunit S [Streptomyces sp. AVP053U2]|uniref:restriction endonuclease subunit S n=1 Tax=Streptomyces sp. AVP053U2 TaxID=1737066 RepID=UPI00073BCE17|nr:restriction endonuclease subunit S [Streptomyces sp. AVP053U2]ODA72390.1 Type-1 restriction enzyme EcoKI specificity protein [Streptomyces sp. AVP053U2]